MGKAILPQNGNDFWFGFMQNYLGDPGGPGSDRMKIYVTADNIAANGTVSVPLGGWSQTFTVKPNSTTEIVIPTNLAMCTESDMIENKGIHLVSDVPVSVYQLNYVKQTSDASIIIPTPYLGTRYRAMTYTAKTGDFEASQILIVAAYDGTAIKITPKCATVGPGGTMGHPPNVAYKITLNKGEVYQIKGNYTAPLDLTGTLIELDTTVSDNCRKFAVFSGNMCTRVPDSASYTVMCCCNNLVEEMMPVKTWGTKYITVPLKTRKKDVFRITAAQNNTMITWDGSAPIGLNAGDFYEYSSGTATYVESNKPISVAQFSKSSKADNNVNSDPFMIMLQPIDQTLGRIVFNSFSSTIITNYYLNVVTRTLYTGVLNLDGNTIPASSFKPVPYKKDYSYAQLSIKQGNHTLRSDSGYTANIYGYGPYESFGYIAGATFIDPAIGYDIITPTAKIRYYNYTDTVCRGIELKFEAIPNPLITDFFWNFGDGSSVVHKQKTSHTYNKAGKYVLTFYYQKSNICGLDSIVWNINIKCCNPKPGIDGATPVCAGDNTTITDTSAYNSNAVYKWDFGRGKVVTGSGQGPYGVNYTVTGKDTVWVFVSEPGCPADSANYVITVNPVPESEFTLESPVCVNRSTVITYTGNASSTAKYEWDFDGGYAASGTGGGPYIVSWSNAGTYNVGLKVTEGGCSSPLTSHSILVYPSPNPVFTANPQTTSTEQPVITFTDNSSNTQKWLWNFGDPSSGGENTSSLQSPVHSYSGEGHFTVWLLATSAEGCIDSASAIITISDYHTFYVPNAFTPDNDGLNDSFQPYGTDLKKYELYIFNRWGAQIFKSGKEIKAWDGRFDGKMSEPGVYAWRIIYTDMKNLKRKAYGRVTLLR